MTARSEASTKAIELADAIGDLVPAGEEPSIHNIGTIISHLGVLRGLLSGPLVDVDGVIERLRRIERGGAVSPADWERVQHDLVGIRIRAHNVE